MKASIIIPVWNGAPVVLECLGALYAHSGSQLHEVVCVDNASPDDAAALIATHYPQSLSLRQPVNLGFAGGVNVGLSVATGDVMILLNQDCLAQPGWLDALLDAIQEHPEFGLFGCLIEEADGAINHIGAFVRHPDAVGVHRTDLGENTSANSALPAEFVTGAAFAIPRKTWNRVGPFDEGFYPAYYEDADYCYRARRLGIETACIPAARLRHLFTSTQWQTDPVGHATNGYRGRYRFVCKHFAPHEITAFFAAETEALAEVKYINHALGRLLAAQDTLRRLPETLASRQSESRDPSNPVLQRQLEAGFVQLAHLALQSAEKLALAWQPEAPPSSHPPVEINFSPDLDQQSRLEAQWAESYRNIEALRQRQEALLTEMRASLSGRSGRKLVQLADSGERQRQFELAILQQARLDALEGRLELAAQRAEHYRLQNEALLAEIRRLAEWCNTIGVQAAEIRPALNALEQRLQILLQLIAHDPS